MLFYFLLKPKYSSSVILNVGSSPGFPQNGQFNNFLNLPCKSGTKVGHGCRAAPVSPGDDDIASLSSTTSGHTAASGQTATSNHTATSHSTRVSQSTAATSHGPSSSSSQIQVLPQNPQNLPVVSCPLYILIHEPQQ